MKNVTPQTTARALALELLLAVAQEQKPLDALLPRLYEAPLSASDKAFARQLIMSSLRHHGQLWALIEGYLERPLALELSAVAWLLRMALAQLLLLQTPPHAAIDTSVDLCKKLGFVHQAGLVNAVLRKLDRAKPALPPASYNLPSWLKGSWRKAYGNEALEAIAAQGVQEPPLDLSFALAQPDLTRLPPQAQRLLPHTLRLPVQDMTKLQGFNEGHFWAQDVAASLPVRALGDVSGKRVLDLCAAPGGKTLQLCAGGAQVVALDKSVQRLQRVHENVARLGFDAKIIAADVLAWQPETAFDAVLLDAPCSATGTLRRHPDICLLKRPHDVAEMKALQQQILHAVLRWLPACTPLIYSVCSLEPDEGEAQIAWLLQQYPALKVVPIHLPDGDAAWHTPQGFLRTLPHYWAEKGGMDGFFIAKLVRSE